MALNIKFVLTASLVLFGSLTSAASSQSMISNILTLQIDLIDQQQATEKAIVIVDVASGKKARILLPQNPTGTGFSGQFTIQFLKGDDQKRDYEFKDEKGQPYFAFSLAAFGSRRILLSKDQERLSKEVFGYESASRISSSPVEISNEEVKKDSSQPPVQTVLSSKVSVEDLKRLKTESETQILLSEKAQINIELNESQMRAEQLILAERMSLEQKKKNSDKALIFVKEADQNFFDGNFQEAFKLYAEAIKLAPQEESYYYRYAVSAYKLGQFEKSLALLSLAEVPLSQATEKTYYQGLNRLKLNDNDKALKDFLEVVEEKDPKLSPISAYLAGVLQYQRKDFSSARKSMQLVLDTSDDQKLDRSADEMLDLIDRLEQFTESQKEKYRFNFYLGLNYDENVLNLSTVNASTDASALRLSYGASALAYVHKSMNSDLALQFSISDIYSVDTDFQVSGILQATDPLEYSFTAPYALNFQYNQQSYFLNLTPIFKSLAMNVDGEGRDEILQTSGANLSLSRIFKSNLTGSLKLEYLNEISKLDISSADDDQTGQKLSLGIQTTYFLDLKGEESVSVDFNQLNNNSKGDNYFYDTTSLAIIYGTALRHRWLGQARLDFARQDYSKLSSQRIDEILSLGLSFSKTVKKDQAISLGLSHSISSSNDTSYDYNKWQVTALWTYQARIFEK